VVNRAAIVVGGGTSVVFEKVVASEGVFVAISSAVVSNAVGAEAVTAIEIAAMVAVLVSLVVGIDKIVVGVRQLLQDDTIEDMTDEADCQCGVFMLVDCQCFVPEPVLVNRPDGVVFQCLVAVSVSKR
jgi:hypothetical protein